MSMKNPLTPAGIEPATFRSVAQYLNHGAIAVPVLNCVLILNCFQLFAVFISFSVLFCDSRIYCGQ